jgi:hypothetical protein
MSEPGEGRFWWFALIGIVFGGLAWLVTFVAVYIAAVASVGWVIGIALGWFPALLAAILAFVIFRYLWWLIALGAALMVWKLMQS